MVKVFWSFIALALVSTQVLNARQGPVAVSPGHPEVIAPTESRCPTFSWSEMDEAGSYELVVYRLGEPGQSAEPVLRQVIGVSTLSWTPSLDRCLKRGGQYAWSVRASGSEDSSEWSDPMLFRVMAVPSQVEFEEAFEVVLRYLAENAETANQTDDLAGKTAGIEISRDPVIPMATAGVVLNTTIPEGQAEATLTVVGEVRTVDLADEPRLWGKGRPDTVVHIRETGHIDLPCINGSIKFGLSHAVVDWGSAADACPAGTWVCTHADVVPCNTDRPDSGTADRLECDGTAIDDSAGSHTGWIADYGTGTDIYQGLCRKENLTNPLVEETCVTMPVWCCWE